MRGKDLHATLRFIILKTDVPGIEQVICCPLFERCTFGIVILLRRFLALQQALSVTSLVSGRAPLRLHSIIAVGLASSDKQIISMSLPRAANADGSTVVDMSLALTDKKSYHGYTNLKV